MVPVAESVLLVVLQPAGGLPCATPTAVTTVVKCSVNRLWLFSATSTAIFTA